MIRDTLHSLALGLDYVQIDRYDVFVIANACEAIFMWIAASLSLLAMTNHCE